MTTLINYIGTYNSLILSVTIFVCDRPLDSMDNSLVLLVTQHTTTLMTVTVVVIQNKQFYARNMY